MNTKSLLGILTITAALATQAHAQSTFRWTKIPGITNLPANWSAAPTSIDVTNGIVYSAMNGTGWKFNMRNNSFQSLPISNWPANLGSDLWSRSVYDGAGGNLYLYYGGSSYVYRLPTSGGSPTLLGGTGANGQEYQNMWYWNPTTESVGKFGGYGFGAVENWRYEFQAGGSSWSQIEANVPGRGPWGRTARNYAVDPTGRRIFLFGGDGNSTGQQGYVDPGFVGNGSTSGQMDKLYDLWELNLSTGTGIWTNYIAANAYAFPWEGSIVYFPPLNAILMVNGAGIMSTNLGQPVTSLLMFRIGQDTNFVSVPMSGDIPSPNDQTPNLDGSLFYDNSSQRVYCFNNAGVYTLSVGPTVSLIKAVKPSFSYLSVGTNYQLQVSADLSTWTNQGSAFTATNTSMIYPQYWNVDNWSQLFFRLQVAP